MATNPTSKRNDGILTVSKCFVVFLGHGFIYGCTVQNCENANQSRDVNDQMI